MKLLTLFFSLFAIIGVVIWLQSNHSLPKKGKFIANTQAQTQPVELILNSKTETSHSKTISSLPSAEEKTIELGKIELEPLRHRPTITEPVSTETELDDGERLGDEAAENAELELPSNWAETIQIAIDDPDPVLRGEAIHSVSLNRSEEAIAVLTKVSTIDPDPSNRANAIQALWNSAADNLDTNVGIKDLLLNAQSDPDPIVASVATKAIADLERLTKRRGRGS